MSTNLDCCPYCGAPVKIVDSSILYNGRSYGWAYVCNAYPKCDAYVGCHPGTKRPLGRLANKELRLAKTAAHEAFDAVWKKNAEQRHLSPKEARIRGYAWLADALMMLRKDCHIGMMDLETCRRVVEICSKIAQSEKETVAVKPHFSEPKELPWSASE